MAQSASVDDDTNNNSVSIGSNSKSSNTDATTYHPSFSSQSHDEDKERNGHVTPPSHTTSTFLRDSAKKDNEVDIGRTEPNLTTTSPKVQTSRSHVNNDSESAETPRSISSRLKNYRRLKSAKTVVRVRHRFSPTENAEAAVAGHAKLRKNVSTSAAQSHHTSTALNLSSARLQPSSTATRHKKKVLPKTTRTRLVWPGSRPAHDRHRSHKTFGLLGIHPRTKNADEQTSSSSAEFTTESSFTPAPLPAVLDAGQRSLDSDSSHRIASLFPKKSPNSIKATSTEKEIRKNPPKRPDPVYPQPKVNEPAAECSTSKCRLPDCYCGGSAIPGSLSASNTPQLVLLTFDDSINELNQPLYQNMFDAKRVNPNGCPISATFFVSHEWTNYGLVRNMYADGHEIASHTISHSHGEDFSEAKWQAEIVGQREILAAYGGVHMEDIRGMRAPFLSIGGNKMYNMLYKENFTYDSSMPVYDIDPPIWPFTLDYRIQHDCMIKPCPDKSYPGIWQIPMVMWEDLNGGRCNMVDACARPSTAEDVFQMHMNNFNRHYNSNRAVFPLFFHSAWFNTPHLRQGFMAFLDHISAMDDVWLVTAWQAIQWMREPQSLETVKQFPPFSCNNRKKVSRCNKPRRCKLTHGTGIRYMSTCQGCPNIYPWIGNTGVKHE